MSTQFVTATVFEQNSFEAGQDAIKIAFKKMGSKKEPDLIVLFCSSHYDYKDVLRGIKSIVGDLTPIIGCSSAGQFSNEGITKNGLSCALITSDNYRFFSGIGTSLKNQPIQAVEAATFTFPRDFDGYSYQSAMLFLDTLAGKGEEAVLAALSVLGRKTKFAGAAAADNLAFQSTSVFGDGHVFNDAVSICLIASRQPIIISVQHGHHPISPPLKITKAEGNILYEVEGRPALEVWKDYLREELKTKGIDVDQLEPKDFSPILLKYEAGLMTGSNYKMRFPASCNPDGSFNFVCTIMEGSVIKIMTSEDKDQIESARLAAQIAVESAKGMKLAGAIIFDCACRAMILKEKFVEAIEAMQEVFKDIPFVGCETYGEIAMEIGQLSGFHNTTTVIMLFPE